MLLLVVLLDTGTDKLDKDTGSMRLAYLKLVASVANIQEYVIYTLMDKYFYNCTAFH